MKALKDKYGNISEITGINQAGNHIVLQTGEKTENIYVDFLDDLFGNASGYLPIFEYLCREICQLLIETEDFCEHEIIEV